MRLNVATAAPKIFTHEGGVAKHIRPEQALRRSVLSCLLWEKEFYEDGKSIAERISEHAAKVSKRTVADLAIEARTVHGLRHVPLLLLLDLVRRGNKEAGDVDVGEVIDTVIRRADEIGELVALYWAAGGNRKMLPRQLRKGLARALNRFGEYKLAKYNRDGTVKLRDVLFLTHTKPKDEKQGHLLSRLANKSFVPEKTKSGFNPREAYGLGENEVGLVTPDTWETNLSGGADKKETWERLIREDKLGYLALLRNLRNMVQVGVDMEAIRDAIIARKGAELVWPFRYTAAARAVPQLEPYIDQALCEAIATGPRLSGRTVVLVDVSHSMDVPLSAKSDLTRVDAAATLASIIHGDVRMFSFSDSVVEVPPRRGMAGVDTLVKSQEHRGTRLFDAVAMINQKVVHDRMIVITDEQASGRVAYGAIQGNLMHMPDPLSIGYVINIASAQNGVGYGKWRHIDGFSEAVLRFIVESENLER